MIIGLSRSGLPQQPKVANNPAIPGEAEKAVNAGDARQSFCALIFSSQDCLTATCKKQM
jgi:hypothetical protein